MPAPVALLVALSEAPDWGWGSARVVGLLAAAVVLCDYQDCSGTALRRWRAWRPDRPRRARTISIVTANTPNAPKLASQNDADSGPAALAFAPASRGCAALCKTCTKASSDSVVLDGRRGR
jgi:hypothetical protein